MASSDLQPAGVAAVIENLNDYLRGADQMNRATAGIGKAAQDAATQTGNASSGVDKFGKATQDAGKSADGFTSNLGKMAGAIGGLLVKLAPVGAAIGAAFSFKKGIEAVSELGSEVGSLQRITGDTAEASSKLVFAFDQTGVGVNRGVTALTKFSKALGGVADLEDGTAIPTGKAMADVLFNLGVRTQDADGKTRPFSDLLGDLTEIFKGMPDGIEKTALATQLFGRNGKDLLPFLNKGKAGLAELGDEAERFGLVLDDATVKQTKALKVAQRQFGEALHGISVQLGVALLPIATAGVTIAAKLAEGFNRNVIPFIKTLAQIVTAVLTPVMARFVPILAKFATAFAHFVNNAVLTGLTKGVPLIRKFADGMRDLGRIFVNSFKDFDLGAENLGALPKILQPIAVLVAIVGAAIRKVVDDFRSLIDVAGAVFLGLQFLAGGLDNIRLIASLNDGVIGKLLTRFADLVEVLGKFFDKVGGGESVFSSFAKRLGNLSDKIIPALSIVLEGLLGLLALRAIGEGITNILSLGKTLADFALGPLKLAAGLVSDFVGGLAGIVGKAISITANIAGTALDFITSLAGFVKDGASFVVNATLKTAQTIADFVKGLISGINAELATQPIQLQLPGGNAEKAGQKTGQSFLGGFLKAATDPASISNLVSGIIGGIAGALATTAAAATLAAAIGGGLVAAAPVIAVLFGVALAAAILYVLPSRLRKVILLSVLSAITGVPIATELTKAIASGFGQVAGRGVALIATAILLLFIGLPFFIERQLRAHAKDFGKAVVNGLIGSGEFIAEEAAARAPGIARFIAQALIDPTFLAREFAKAVPSIISGFGELFRQIGIGITKLPGLVVDLPVKIGSVFAEGFSKLDDLTRGALSGIGSNFAAFAQSFADGFRSMWRDIDELTGGALTQITDGIKDALSGLGDLFGGIADIAGAAFDTIAPAVVGALTDALSGAKSIMGQIRDVMVGGFTFIVGGIKALVGGLGATVNASLGLVSNAIGSAIGFMASKVASILRAVDRALDAIDRLVPDSVQNAITSAAAALESIAGQAAPISQGSPRDPTFEGPGAPNLQRFAGGTNGPLTRATEALVGEEGSEVALLGRGRALLPAGSEVLSTSASARLLATLQGLTTLAPGGVGGRSVSVTVPISIDGGGTIDWSRVDAIAKVKVGEALQEARIQSQRQGSRLGSSIG